jgi:aryl-alcohol dehydrogenase-like predicted oxidoreductase
VGKERDVAAVNLGLPPLGFGAFKIGRNEGVKYPSVYEIPDDRAVESLLNGVLDLGIRYIDTAPAYGCSEERIGRFIGHRRGEYILSTKVGEEFIDGRSVYDFSERAVRGSVARSLRLLRRDALDLVLVHSSANDLEVLRETDVAATLLALKQAGDVREVGFSGYSAEGFHAAMAWCDAVMVPYHSLDRSLASVISEAGRRNVAVVVKKGLGSGRLSASEAIPFVLSNPAVSSMVVGSLSLEHLRENLRLARESRGAQAGTAAVS